MSANDGDSGGCDEVVLLELALVADDLMLLGRYVSVRIISPGCEKMQAMIDAMKAAETDTAHLMLASVNFSCSCTE